MRQETVTKHDALNLPDPGIGTTSKLRLPRAALLPNVPSAGVRVFRPCSEHGLAACLDFVSAAGTLFPMAPILRWREGDTVNLYVSNALPPNSIHGHDTSIHWHDILLPPNMDGVPGISLDGIRRDRTTVV